MEVSHHRDGGGVLALGILMLFGFFILASGYVTSLNALTGTNTLLIEELVGAVGFILLVLGCYLLGA